MRMRKFQSSLNNKRGETLIEVVVSTAIFIILITTMVTLLLGALGINTKAHMLNKADMNIIAEFDGTTPGPGIVTKETKTTTDPIPAPKFEISFGPTDVANIKADGTYITGTAGRDKAPLKLFQPN